MKINFHVFGFSFETHLFMLSQLRDPKQNLLFPFFRIIERSNENSFLNGSDRRLRGASEAACTQKT